MSSHSTFCVLTSLFVADWEADSEVDRWLLQLQNSIKRKGMPDKRLSAYFITQRCDCHDTAETHISFNWLSCLF